MDRSIKTKYIHVAIMIALTFGIGFLPPFGAITELGMKVLGVFVGLIYGWVFIDLLWPSLFGFVALASTGYITVGAGFSSGFGDETLLICLVVSVFAEALNQLGITKTIAYWALSRKIFVGKPWLLVFAIVFIAILLGIAGGSFAAVFLLWNVVLSVAELGGYKKGDRIIGMLIALVLFACFTAGQIVPFQAIPLLYAGFIPESLNFAYEPIPFFILGLIEVIIAMIFMMLISKFILKVDASNFSLSEELSRKYALHKVPAHQKVAIVLLVAYFVVLFLPYLIPNATISPAISSIGIIGVSIIYMIVFTVWKNDDGTSLVDIGECFKNGIPWSVMILFAITFPLADALQAEETGVMATINTTIVPVLDNLGPTVFIVLAVVIMGLLTQVLHNIVLGAIFLPFMAPIYVGMGGNIHTLFFLSFLVLQCAYATPAGSMQAGMLFGNEWVARKDAFLYGTMFFIVNLILLLLMIPICNSVF